jgi:hypothetical protein
MERLRLHELCATVTSGHEPWLEHLVRQHHTTREAELLCRALLSPRGSIAHVACDVGSRRERYLGIAQASGRCFGDEQGRVHVAS